MTDGAEGRGGALPGPLARLKTGIRRVPWIGPLAVTLSRYIRLRRARAAFPGSSEYWESRYARGGTSGHGSYGRFAEFKAEVLNRFVAEQRVRTVLELGCGDGNQLELAEYPAYVGLDVSDSALEACARRFAADGSKSFQRYDASRPIAGDPRFGADLCLSLDVIYHLTEDRTFESYMKDLFGAAGRFVIIYSSDTDITDPAEPPHVRHRKFSAWVERNIAGWQLARTIPNRYPQSGDGEPGSFAEFFIYVRRPGRESD